MSRRVLVTGAGAGIGLACALRFADEGAEIVLVGRGLGRLERAARDVRDAGGRPRVIPADVSRSDEVASAFEGLDAVDVVVANAGICRQARLDSPEALMTWREVLGTNLDGALNTFHALQNVIVPGGRVIAVSSGLGKQGRAGYAAYTASKHGVIGLVRALAKEWAPRRITVNAVCPGWVDTGMAAADLDHSAVRGHQTAEDARREAEAAIPLGRFVRADEVAGLIHYLSSAAAGAITGQAINI
jgi:NAD(P)-dependent dehydrogenase (short-subunit alcohol dehydrogenase family)